MARPAAEIEPQARICSSNRILPGRVCCGNNVEQQPGGPHLVRGKRGKGHQGEKGGPACLANGRVQQRYSPK
jgi:hypothetical protein